MNQERQDPPGPQTAGRSTVRVAHQTGEATAEVSCPPAPHGTASATFSTRHGQVPAEVRRDLVDAVLEQPGVRDSDHLHVVMERGDFDTLARIGEHATNVTARAAGSSSVVDADLVHPEDE